MQPYSAAQEVQIERLEFGKVYLTPDNILKYLNAPDTMEIKIGDAIPVGYKRCGKCGKYKKLYMFNRSNSAKNGCAGNCKECQKETSRNNYAKQKKEGKVQERYEQTREQRLERSKGYYQENKATILQKQKKYHKSSKGKKAMRNAHAKRKYLLQKHVGIPYTREMLVDRDRQGAEFPICVLCGKPIHHVDKDMHIEHLIPVALGGADDFTNVGCAHQLCNLQKTKDAREISVEQIEALIALSEKYMDEHPDMFAAFYEDNGADS